MEQHEHSHVPAELRRAEIFAKLDRVRQPNYINQGQRTVGNLLRLAESELQHSLGKRKQPGDLFAKPLIFFGGTPGSGKTELINQAQQAFSLSPPLQALFNEGYHLTQHTWEIDGEQQGRDLGLITTPHGKPMQIEELYQADTLLQYRIRQSLDDAQCAALFVEAPLLTAVCKENTVLGRPLGIELLYHATKRVGLFEAAPPYTMYVAGLTGGPLLRDFLFNYRRDYQNLVVEMNDPSQEQRYSHEEMIAEAIGNLAIIASLYNKQPPTTEAELYALLQNGASIEETENIEHTMNETLSAVGIPPYFSIAGDVARDLGLVLSPKDVGYILQLRPEIRNLGQFYWSLSYPRFYRYILETLHFPADHYALARNNPSSEDLGIKNFHHLIRYLNRPHADRLQEAKEQQQQVRELWRRNFDRNK